MPLCFAVKDFNWTSPIADPLSNMPGKAVLVAANHPSLVTARSSPVFSPLVFFHKRFSASFVVVVKMLLGSGVQIS